jgi:hypothetical protein
MSPEIYHLLSKIESDLLSCTACNPVILWSDLFTPFLGVSLAVLVLLYSIDVAKVTFEGRRLYGWLADCQISTLHA